MPPVYPHSSTVSALSFNVLLASFVVVLILFFVTLYYLWRWGGPAVAAPESSPLPIQQNPTTTEQVPRGESPTHHPAATTESQTHLPRKTSTDSKMQISKYETPVQRPEPIFTGSNFRQRPLASPTTAGPSNPPPPPTARQNTNPTPRPSPPNPPLSRPSPPARSTKPPSPRSHPPTPPSRSLRRAAVIPTIPAIVGPSSSPNPQNLTPPSSSDGPAAARRAESTLFSNSSVAGSEMSSPPVNEEWGRAMRQKVREARGEGKGTEWALFAGKGGEFWVERMEDWGKLVSEV